MFTTLFRTPIFFDADDGGGGGGDLDLGDIDLDAIGAEPEPEADPEWAEPAELPEGVDQFDREYVEGLRAEAARYRTRAREAVEKTGDLDLDAARDALAWRDELQTEAGVIKMFYEAGRSLGLGDREIESLFGTPGGPPADEDEDNPDDDLPVTMREVRQFLQEQVLAPQQQAAELAAQQEFAAQLKTRIDGVFDELEIGTDEERGAIAALADQLVPAGKENDQDAIEMAVRQATQRWNDAAAARLKAYVEGKRKVASSVPKSTGGGAAPGAEPEHNDPPKSIAEAIERRKARERAARGE